MNIVPTVSKMMIDRKGRLIGLPDIITAIEARRRLKEVPGNIVFRMGISSKSAKSKNHRIRSKKQKNITNESDNSTVN
jgi:hypothetical protein